MTTVASHQRSANSLRARVRKVRNSSHEPDTTTNPMKKKPTPRVATPPPQPTLCRTISFGEPKKLSTAERIDNVVDQMVRKTIDDLFDRVEAKFSL